MYILLFILQFEELGLVTSIENNHKNVPSARKGSEVCIKIDAIPGSAPKMFGRHFDETDILCSKVIVIQKLNKYRIFQLSSQHNECDV